MAISNPPPAAALSQPPHAGCQGFQHSPSMVLVPSILLILIDDYGYSDVGYHNIHADNKLKTPSLDGLSSTRAVRLENYYTQHICTPTRSQLLSGRYQIHTGLQHGVILPKQPQVCQVSKLHCPLYTFAQHHNQPHFCYAFWQF